MKFVERAAGKCWSYETFLRSGVKDTGWRVAIPSYARAKTIARKTLPLLASRGIPPERVDVFVANESEMRIYSETLERGTYSRIIVAQKGMGAVRRFIQDYYEAGTKLVCLDDDLDDLYKIDAKGAKARIEDLGRLFDYAFCLCSAVKSGYWGIYAVDNAYFMRRKIALGLRYLEGSAWGCVVNHDRATYVTLDDKEDFERSVRAYLKYGTVVRMDFVGMTTNFYTEPGGMQVERTERRISESARRMLQMFPHQCKVNEQRKEHLEVKLVEQREAWKKRARETLDVV